MSGTTSVPTVSFGAAGFVAPTELAILAGVQADIDAAFGGGLNPALTTPQGQLASSETAIIGDANDQFIALANGVDPAFADGRMQDAIARIYFLARNPAQSTVVAAMCIGLAGVPIPTGALAKATDGNIYSCTAGGTIPSGGNIVLPFACVTTGPIACPAGSLTEIYQTVPGWDTISNAADGALGNVVEGRAAFEARRQATVQLNASNTVVSARAAVLELPGVLDCYATENPTGANITTGGVTILKNSLYICVAGGAAADIAQAIWNKKPPGCGYTGNTTVTVTDTNAGYVTPQPTYGVTFQTPTSLPFYFAVTLANSPNVPADALMQIQAAIILAFAGGDGGPRAKIGSEVFASRFYVTVAVLGAWAQIVTLFIGTSASPTGSTVQVQINQVPAIAAANITLALV